ncbi:MAG: hypothetical protein ACLUBZ_00060 [Ruthenibacterium lactatiformans]|uniref:hypothetical protein n=1 Tax=Ruthenibacterium lactatiformans TaxID=1550024 RepID=UPI00399570BB
MHTNYIIPVNFTDAGKLLGTFPVRNSIEAFCLLVPVALICLNLPGLSFTVRLMLTVGGAVIVCGVALTGINDDSLSQFLSAWLRWRRRRAAIFYRGK